MGIDVEPEKWQYESWLRFQGSVPRRRRKNSPQRNEKDGSSTESSTIRAERTSPTDIFDQTTKANISEGLSTHEGFQAMSSHPSPSTHLDLNIGPAGMEFNKATGISNPNLTLKQSTLGRR